LRVRVTALNKVDLPTLGSPTIPALSIKFYRKNGKINRKDTWAQSFCLDFMLRQLPNDMSTVEKSGGNETNTGDMFHFQQRLFAETAVAARNREA